MFKLSFETETAAFDDTPGIEVARILRHVADNLYQGPVADTLYQGPFATKGSIQDIKGNIIGKYNLTKAA